MTKQLLPLPQQQQRRKQRKRKQQQQPPKIRKGEYDLVVTCCDDDDDDDDDDNDEPYNNNNDNDEGNNHHHTNNSNKNKNHNHNHNNHNHHNHNFHNDNDNDDNDDNNDDDDDEEEEEERWYNVLQTVIMKPLLPDTIAEKKNCTIVSWFIVVHPIEIIRLLKFVTVTILGILSTYCFVRWMDWEYDPNYTIESMILYDSDFIVMDTIVFFIIGRLYQQRGVDHIAWMTIAGLACIYDSFINNIPFLQHHISLYQMRCIWPWKLWMYVIVLVSLCSILIFKHIQYSIMFPIFINSNNHNNHHNNHNHNHTTTINILGQKCFEIGLSVLIFVVPKAMSPYFHLHHWFAGWIIGMHCNFDVAWSRFTMAWCWGCYINGIAVYGRDPTLTCGYSLFVSENNRCPFLKCYEEAKQHPENHTDIVLMEPLEDWWNCSAGTIVGTYNP